MNYPFKTICCIISSPCHLCNLEYDKVELRIGTKNNRNYSKRKSMIYRDLTLEVERQKIVVTPYGEPSAPLAFGHFAGIPVVFLPRHGGGHTIPPHRVNYRANIWALESVGIKRIISVASVGGITMEPGILCVPDQIIDYTWGRDHTFVDCCDVAPIKHVDFSQPYCGELRDILIKAGRNASVRLKMEGTYGATQGPRLETAAEI